MHKRRVKVSPVKLSWFLEVQLPEITDIPRTMSDLALQLDMRVL